MAEHRSAEVGGHGVLKRKRILIGGLIVTAAIGYLGFLGIRGTAIYYYTVGEVLDQGRAVYGETVRVNGHVVPGSVVTEQAGLRMIFTIAGQEKSLEVLYQGAVPDAFREDIDIVVEGAMDSDGTFRARSILTKCPSRYEPE